MLEKQISRLKLYNVFTENYSIYSIDRMSFKCVEVSIPTSGDWYKRISNIAKDIEENLHKGQANTSRERDDETVEKDNLLGVIAEYACDAILRICLGDKNVHKPIADSAKNQIDIMLESGRKTIEVRSSCVRNGVDFAIFAKKKDKLDEQYFDVIGPYTNGYKPGEKIKDYYMRVLYYCDKNDFMKLVEQPTIKLYITGGATKQMMEDENFYQIKYLTPAGGEVERPSNYRVVPLGKSLDIDEFIGVIKGDMFPTTKE